MFNDIMSLILALICDYSTHSNTWRSSVSLRESNILLHERINKIIKYWPKYNQGHPNLSLNPHKSYYVLGYITQEKEFN